MSWCPLGRPVGTTIYPGMQMMAVAIWKALGFAGRGMSLNDVCCYCPAWFGAVASCFLGALTYECSGSANAGVLATGVMSMIPAHIMRSVGGGYDNESFAITAMLATFYFWVRSLRKPDSWPVGALAGVAYIYMVATWGGYIFVLNMVAVHCGALIALGRYTPGLHKAYSLFYVIGTIGAIQVPVVGWTPLKSLEQLGACAVFLGIQVVEAVEARARARKLGLRERVMLHAQALCAAGMVALVLVGAVAQTGYFGPLSSRVRGLFVKHTRTGNPLVDSVAEHQPASATAYYTYLHCMRYLAPLGFGLCLTERTDAKIFALLYGCIAYFFSAKMMRLLILLGPIASLLGGVGATWLLEWAAAQFVELELEGAGPGADGDGAKPAARKAGAKSGGRGARAAKGDLAATLELAYGSAPARLARKVGAGLVFLLAVYYGYSFNVYSQRMAEGMSQPSIMFQARLNTGQPVMIDDYREAYWWLRDHTPSDARVMAWWDYGYQITGIGNRTTIADGNTWNHEHIALLGRCLTSAEAESHKMIRHMADYVLVWTGGGGDDLAKSPHMARIGTSVYADICPGDPTCRQYGFVDRQMTPTPMMAASLLYKLHGHGQKPGVSVDPSRFREVYTSRYNKVRIFKVVNVSSKSKKWVADPANRDCDAPGSWYCPGKYPPALQKLVNKGKAFAQLEDFNVKRDGQANEHYKEYMRRMDGGGDFSAPGAAGYSGSLEDDDDDDDDEEEEYEDEEEEEEEDEYHEDDEDPYAEDDGADGFGMPPPASDAPAPGQWADTEMTTHMWTLVNQNDVETIRQWLQQDPNAVHMRSSDGRGPLWWAYEYHRGEIVQLLLAAGANANLADANGMTPEDLK